MGVVAPLDVLGRPRAREILRLIWAQERSAGEIAGRFEVTFGAVSQHLARLREAGVVRVRRDGRRRLYRADRRALGPFAAALEAFWGPRLAEIGRMAEAREGPAGGPGEEV